MQSLTIACVLKTGGHYDAEYVRRLYVSVQRHVPEDHIFACITNVGKSLISANNYFQFKLSGKEPGWWSKMELFGFKGPVLTLDLDLVPVDDLTPICDVIRRLKNKQFMMLRGLRQEPWCSSVMGWNGDVSIIQDIFIHDTENAELVKDERGYHYRIDSKLIHGDQEFTVPVLEHNGFEMIGLQDSVSGIYSFKDQIRSKPFPENTRLVVFHGRPRVRNIISKPSWMTKEGWNNK
jgi:hypothetical protein